ncbi:thiamine pyrophosphate-binding protein, partial [Pseudoalteromonas sp. Z1A6]|uniref:thiamine pyrophosphate-binding protein n=1 Tax=Pseudoalteromonas sp. Z1A6 TaxID=2686349 RepID=UPI0013FD982B
MSQLITKEKNAQIIISLLKAHGIRIIVASPGTTNVALIGSIQNDPYFTIYSSVDERSAAYLACGLAEESGEPVVISCTGATASRNYAPGLTEAYYRKLPVLAITSMQQLGRVGHNVAQVIDRSVIQNDVAKYSVELPVVKDAEDLWDCEIKVNIAILELKRNGGGPVHINLPTTYSLPFENKELPKYRVINRISIDDEMPELLGRVAVFVGAHKKWSEDETQALDKFCELNNAVVFCDHTSGYKGKFRLLFSLVATQDAMEISQFKPDVMIHIGEVSGDYASIALAGKSVWRVSEDGEVRDPFRKLRYIFDMKEKDFFTIYGRNLEPVSNHTLSYFDECRQALEAVRSNLPELPISNIWVASQIAHKIPRDSILHLGILNSLRSWNFFDVPQSVSTSSNVGGFGIDGVLSTLIGSSLAKPNKLNFCVLGDLAFFYDMNVMGNRHVGRNLRILIINNGKGTEFRQYNHHAAYFGEGADQLIAAAEHYGNKSSTLVKNYAENLGFEYLSAKTKDEFSLSADIFLDDKITDRPIVFEVFTDSDEESKALELIRNIAEDRAFKIKKKAKKMLGSSGMNV